MKKLFLTLILTLTLLPAYAQEDPNPSRFAARDEFGAALLVGSYYQIAGVLTGGLGSLFESARNKGINLTIPFLCPVSVEYAHWFSDRIAVGAGFYFDYVSFLPKMSAVGQVSVMPDFRVVWLEGDDFKLYSKIAVGYSQGFELVKGNDGKLELYPQFLMSTPLDIIAGRSLNLPLGCQLSPLCAEGRTAFTNLDFYCECGIGVLGFCVLGLKKYF